MRLGVLSDLHWPSNPGASAAWHNPYDFARLPDRVDAALRGFAEARVDAVVVCGDVTDAGDGASARAVFERVSAGVAVPVLVVAGNHDAHEGDDPLERCVTGWCETLTGAGVEVGGLRIAGAGIERDPAAGTLRWTRSDVPAVGRPVGIVVSHFPVLSRAERLAELGLAYAGDLTNRRALHEQLRGTGPVVVLSGHLHARESHAHEELLQLSAGALVEPPHEAAIVDVRVAQGEIRVRRRVRVLGPPGPWRDPALAPEDETWTWGADGWRRAASVSSA